MNKNNIIKLFEDKKKLNSKEIIFIKIDDDEYIDSTYYLDDYMQFQLEQIDR